MSRTSLSLAEARRIALAAQGFYRKRPASVGTPQLRRTLRELGVVQIDSVSVLAQAHYLPAFSRLGPYDRAKLDDLIYGRREFLEVWAHEASIVPADHWPLLQQQRLANDRRLRALAGFMKQKEAYAREVLDRIRTRGPVVASEVAEPDGTRGKASQWWGWTTAKAVLEGHFASGALAIARRRTAGFAREYDLLERVLPAPHRTLPDIEEARRMLLLIAARAVGIGTAADIADYHRVNIRTARAVLTSLVADGALQEVRVEGWRDAAYLHPAATTPRAIGAAALLSPFDPVVWYRPRTHRLFNFEYRIEIYVPEPKRKFGYYVLPFLLGEHLVGRVDLKTDRANDRLLVRAAHREPDADAEGVAAALAEELGEVARWLKLSAVECSARGNLARALRSALRERR